ncbi:MAG TPA: hypothetical protein VKV04_20450 [Verrucomicrobiae bacterium]|nr:hypothetical protein [Verrucomicrobiae bacterium]
MNQDEEHLRLLSIFHYVCAGLGALCACFPIFHLILGLILTLHPESLGKDQPPTWFGDFIVAFASAIILSGWIFAGLLAYAGHCLARRKHYTFCIVMAGISCMFMPFGTLLGIFSIVVLLRPSVKALFNGGTPPAFGK